MPRRSILSAVEKEGLIAIPINKEGLIERYTLCEKDISWVNQRRGDQNRLGMAIQICLLRYPGQGLLPNSPTQAPNELVTWVAEQLNIDPDQWDGYALRSETRREHLLVLRAYLKIAAFGISEHRQLVLALTNLASQSDKGIVLAEYAVTHLRNNSIIGVSEFRD